MKIPIGDNWETIAASDSAHFMSLCYTLGNAIEPLSSIFFSIFRSKGL